MEIICGSESVAKVIEVGEFVSDYLDEEKEKGLSCSETGEFCRPRSALAWLQ